MSLEWEGLEDFFETLENKTKRTLKSTASALYKEGERIMAKAKPLTPVDTGALVNSGHVELPKSEGSKISVELGFGGTAAPYALIVHENLEAHHPVGQAKYLEQPFDEAKDGMSERLAADIKKGNG